MYKKTCTLSKISSKECNETLEFQQKLEAIENPFTISHKCLFSTFHFNLYIFCIHKPIQYGLGSVTLLSLKQVSSVYLLISSLTCLSFYSFFVRSIIYLKSQSILKKHFDHMLKNYYIPQTYSSVKTIATIHAQCI